MSLIVRVFILAACVFTAYAFPNLGNLPAADENVILRAMVTQLKSALESRAANSTNNTQSGCFNNYTNQLTEISAQTTNKTQDCYASANMALTMYNGYVNESLVEVKSQSLQLQQRLANCSSQNSSAGVFDCYIATYDVNLASLYNITSQSQISNAAMSGYEWEVNYATQACVGQVMIENKHNSTLAANQLQGCLNDVGLAEFSKSSSGSKAKRLSLK